jgi:pimeloyl-ACP methyl ester carboxylesterase
MLEATHPRDDEVLHADEQHLVRALTKVLQLPEWIFADNLHSEVAALGHIVEEVESAGPFPPVPVAVITGGMPPPRWIMPTDALRARIEHQRQLAKLSPHSEHIVAKKSGHFPQLSEPDLVLDVLERLVRRSRRGS